MESLHILALTAAILALYQIFLSINVIRNRFKFQVSLGHANHKPLEAAMRAQANFIEYTPITLILLFLLVLFQIKPIYMWLLCGFFVVGRLSHSYGMLVMEQRERFSLLGRRIGMVTTFLIMIISAISLMVMI